MFDDDNRSEFDQLASARHFAQEFVVDHVESVMSFYDADTGYFVHTHDQDLSIGADRPVRHITTVHTCWESLLEDRRGLLVADKARVVYAERLDKLANFAGHALGHPDHWKSEGSGYMYCRARTMSVITRYAASAADANPENARLLLGQIWECQPDGETLGAYGAREVVSPPPEKDPKAQYPTNGYHTYWSTTALRRALTHWQPANAAEHLAAGADRLRLIAGEQMALLAAESSFADPQQLAWALTGIVAHANKTDLVQGGQTYHIVQQGLRQFFDQQDTRGEWPRGAALFNYGNGSGSAYCYIFETVGEMLAVATDPSVDEHQQFAAMLRPYATNLVRLLRHAERTALSIPGGGRGWVSGHRPHSHSPEAWATASTFRYAQRLRVLLGNWTNDVAKRDLKARTATRDGDDLAQRGGTWNVGFGSAGTQLAANFALPTLATLSTALPLADHFTDDPDDEVITDGAGRSAVLFGPPGTGKTTLVEALAGRMNWPFVEITPDMFLNEGLDMVSARADQVFRRMMELDRCVILIDEIDELVQSRTEQAQQLSRFFTTTMLPRLSKLWSAARVLFFANTNGITEVDPAIKRSGRFDAAIFVLPPGLEAKKEILRDSHGIELPDVIWQHAEQGLSGNGTAGETVAWLALVRHDQLPSLAQALEQERSDNQTFTEAMVGAALKPLSADLLANDWSTVSKDDSTPRSLVASQESSQRREQRLFPVFEYHGDELPDAMKMQDGTAFWRLTKTAPKDLDREAFPAEFKVAANGTVSLDGVNPRQAPTEEPSPPGAQ